MKSDKIDIAACFSLFTKHWSPKVIAELNDYQIKLVKIQGEFVWHAHADTDELFLVLDGEMKIAFEDRVVSLSKGQLLIVPKGVQHKPLAEKECQVLLIEPRGVINTGEVVGSQTAPLDDWITLP